MILITEPILFYFLPNPPDGMALYPFVLLRKKEFLYNNDLLRHEKIHLKQQIELLILPFYIFYILNYLFNRLFAGHYKAYRNICFEKQPYRYQYDIHYLEKRPFWAFLKFL